MAQITHIQAGIDDAVAILGRGNATGKERADIAIVCTSVKDHARARADNTAQPGRSVVLRICVTGNISVVYTALQFRRSQISRNAATIVSIAACADVRIIGTIQKFQTAGCTLTISDDTTGIIVAVITAIGSAIADGNGTGFSIGIGHNTSQISVRIRFVIITQSSVYLTVRNRNGTGSRIRISNQTSKILRTGNGEFRQIDILDCGATADIGKQARIAARNGHAGNSLVVTVKSSAELIGFRANRSPVTGQRDVICQFEIGSTIGFSASYLCSKVTQFLFGTDQIGQGRCARSAPDKRYQRIEVNKIGLEYFLSRQQ